MRLPKPGTLGRSFSIFAILCLTAGCQTIGSGTKNVACESFTFVWLSRQDTKGTIRQVGANNSAWISLCGSPRKPD